MAANTSPLTVLVSRDLKKWIESRARKEDKKTGPYIRRVLEAHRTLVETAEAAYPVDTTLTQPKED